jgi:hypothetical protein
VPAYFDAFIRATVEKLQKENHLIEIDGVREFKSPVAIAQLSANSHNSKRSILRVSESSCQGTTTPFNSESRLL